MLPERLPREEFVANRTGKSSIRQAGDQGEDSMSTLAWEFHEVPQSGLVGVTQLEGALGVLCWSFHPHELTSDKRLTMDGWMDGND